MRLEHQRGFGFVGNPTRAEPADPNLISISVITNFQLTYAEVMNTRVRGFHYRFNYASTTVDARTHVEAISHPDGIESFSLLHEQRRGGESPNGCSSWSK